MSKTPLRFGKIVATPTRTSWSQAYNAGNLVAAVSLLQLPTTDEDSALSLAGMGKELLSDLEAEYFTLEIKNLQTIKHAILTICERFSSKVQVSFCAGVLIENILYVYIFGPGKIVMKRAGNVGVLLEQDTNNTLSSASGFILHEDIVVLQTQQFADLISTNDLSQALIDNSLSDMTDSLSPTVHQAQHAGAAALAFSYYDTIPPTESAEQEIQQKESLETETHEETTEDTSQFVHAPQSRILSRLRVSHAKKLYVTIAVILAVVLIASIFFSIQKQRLANNQALFGTLIVPAQKKYEEGLSLEDLNQTLAATDFAQAKQMVQDALQKLPKNSVETTQAQQLLTTISSHLSSPTPTTTSQKIDLATSKFLQIVSTHSDATAFAQDDKSVYLALPSGILGISKSDATETTLIKNTSDWKRAGGLGAYLGNFYVLDTADGIDKYVPTGSNYTKSAYFSSDTPNLSKATSITIDGSIWILFSDGTISKYTRGKQDSLTLSGFDKPLKNPTQIFTSTANTYVYILDNGNSRIVVMDTSGKFVAQYASSIISNARAFEVLEKDKKVYVLSGGNGYEVDMK